MSISDSDLGYYKSAGTDSTGGAISATTITDSEVENLFDNVTATEASAGATEYRKAFIKNSHATLTWEDVVFWKSVATLSTGDEVYVGLGTATDDDGSNQLTALSSNSVIALVSNGADTRVVTVVGEDALGDYQIEDITLTGATEALGLSTFSKVYCVYPDSADASRTVTIKEGSGGTTLGTIAPSKLSAIYYQDAGSKALGIKLGDLAPDGTAGLWFKRVVAQGAGAYTLNSFTVKCEGITT